MISDIWWQDIAEVNISPKNQYFFTDPTNGRARDSRSPWFLCSNISAQSPKKAIFLHKVVIFLHGPPKKTFFYAQLNNKLAKSALHNIIHCFTIFSMILGTIVSCLFPTHNIWSMPYNRIAATVLRVTVPDQYFCTKHPDLNITARGKQIKQEQFAPV